MDFREIAAEVTRRLPGIDTKKIEDARIHGFKCASWSTSNLTKRLTASFGQNVHTINMVIDALLQMREEEPRRLQEIAAAEAQAAADAVSPLSRSQQPLSPTSTPEVGYSLEECVWDWIEFASMNGKPQWRSNNRHQPKREIMTVLSYIFEIVSAEDFIHWVCLTVRICRFSEAPQSLRDAIACSFVRTIGRRCSACEACCRATFDWTWGALGTIQLTRRTCALRGSNTNPIATNCKPLPSPPSATSLMQCAPLRAA